MANCTISGTITNIDGTPVANGVITFAPPPLQPIIAGGNAYTAQPASTTTDLNGNLVPISLPQGLLVVVTISAGGASYGNFVAIVPFASGATFSQMATGVQPPTSNFTVNGQQLFVANGTFTVPGGVTSFIVEAWGGGGGGGGFGSSPQTGGTGGTATVQNQTNTITYVTATGGTGGTGSTAAGGAGGAGGGAPAGTVKMGGAQGFAGWVNDGISGGLGGASPRGDAVNFGHGGQGGGPGGTSASVAVGGGGGGGGGYAMAVVSTAGGTIYNVTIGTMGSGGTGGTAGGGPGALGPVLFTW